MSRLVAPSALAALALAASAASPALAQYENKVQPMEPRPVPLGAVTGARASGVINPDGTLVYGIGIDSVTHLGTGEYCVTLKKKIPAATAVPVMSFNYSSSPGFDVFVVYAPGVSGNCPTNSIPVLTYTSDDASAPHTFADEGFTIVIP